MPYGCPIALVCVAQWHASSITYGIGFTLTWTLAIVELKEHVMTVILVVATILFFVGLDWAVRRARNEAPLPATKMPAPAQQEEPY